MEKKFRITVDGRQYNVTVEDLSDAVSQLHPEAASMPVPARTPDQPVAAPAPAKAAAAGAGDVVATLGGVVESIAVSLGQSVNQGDKVAVIEAMKMKNTMVAARSGKVTHIAVRPGDSVESGQVLLTIG